VLHVEVLGDLRQVYLEAGTFLLLAFAVLEGEAEAALAHFRVVGEVVTLLEADPGKATQKVGT